MRSPLNSISLGGGNELSLHDHSGSTGENASIALITTAVRVLAAITGIYCGALTAFLVSGDPRGALHSWVIYFFVAPIFLAVLQFVLPRARTRTRLVTAAILAVLLLLHVLYDSAFVPIAGAALGVLWLVAAGLQAPPIPRLPSSVSSA